MLIAITGVTEDEQGRRCIAGSGKDTVASILVGDHGFVSISLADPMKRFCAEMFDFSKEQLWGSSEHRNKRDVRFSSLTPRLALQSLGDWGRSLDEDLWVDYALHVASLITHPVRCMYEYTAQAGTVPSLPGIDRRPIASDKPVVPRDVVIPDMRFRNELNRIHEDGGVLWRVKRKVKSIPDELLDHPSEVELLEFDDERFDRVIDNSGTVEDLYAVLEGIAKSWVRVNNVRVDPSTMSLFP